MKTVLLKGITIGNFQYDATVELTDTVMEAVLQQGVLRLLQGAPSGAWEKAVAYPGDKAKRPETNGAGEKWSRKDIAFSPEAASKLASIYKGVEVEVGRNEKDEKVMEDLGLNEIIVTEYSGPEASVPKYKAEKDLLNLYLFEADGKTAKTLKTGEPRTAAAFAENRGIAAPTEPWAEDTEFLANVKAWAKAQAAKED